MRNMSFSMTTEAFLAGTKTVTRRFGWWFLKPGDRVMGVKKAMGLKKGEKIVRLGAIEIISTRPELLCEITPEDVIKEGFPDMTPEGFINMIVKKFGCLQTSTVNRIEFWRVENLDES